MMIDALRLIDALGDLKRRSAREEDEEGGGGGGRDAFKTRTHTSKSGGKYKN